MGHSTQDTKYRIQNTEYRTQKTEWGHRLQITGYRVTRIQDKFGCGFRQKKDLSYFGSEPNSFLEKLDSGSTLLNSNTLGYCRCL